MSNYTYQSFNQNEVRVLKLSMYDNDNATFQPDSATMTVYNGSGAVLETVSIPTSAISTNEVEGLVTTTTTGTPGEYEVVWTINKDDNVYKHKTVLNVLEL